MERGMLGLLNKRTLAVHGPVPQQGAASFLRLSVLPAPCQGEPVNRALVLGGGFQPQSTGPDPGRNPMLLNCSPARSPR